jgi:hypothetical protein
MISRFFGPVNTDRTIVRSKVAILDQDVTCQLFVLLKDRVNARGFRSQRWL